MGDRRVRQVISGQKLAMGAGPGSLAYRALRTDSIAPMTAGTL